MPEITQIDTKIYEFVRNVSISTNAVCDTLNLSSSTYNRYVKENKIKPIQTVGDLIDYLQLRNIDMLF